MKKTNRTANILIGITTLLLTTPFIIILYSKSLNPWLVIILELIAVLLIMISYGVFCYIERRDYFRPTVFLLIFIATMFFAVDIFNVFELSNSIFFNARKEKLNELAIKINKDYKKENVRGEETDKEVYLKFKNELSDVDCINLKVSENKEVWFVVNNFGKHSFGFVRCEKGEPALGFDGRKVSYTKMEENWYSWSN